MVRKTKLEAQATRDHILDAAELVFHQRGVSRATLAEIAQAAGLTRGAIYWHFDDKLALFDAMVQRVKLPMVQMRAEGAARPGANALQPLRSMLAVTLRRLVDDPQLQRVFEIMTQKVEYVDELNPVRERHLEGRASCLVDFEQMFRNATAAGDWHSRLPVHTAAVVLHALFDGLIRNWLLDPTAFDLVRVGAQAVDTLLAGLNTAATPQRRGTQRTTL